jgi:hypothetical protein
MEEMDEISLNGLALSYAAEGVCAGACSSRKFSKEHEG